MSHRHEMTQLIGKIYLGAIYLWCPHGDGRSDSGGRMWTEGRGVKPHVDVHTEN